MYIKVKDRALFKELDDNLVIPSRWSEFISKRKEQHNLIIKQKDKWYKCTNCHIIFESDEKVKVNDYLNCPNCNNLFLIKTKRLKSYDFKEELAVLEKYKEYYILRQFRLETLLKNNRSSSYDYEYARVIFDDKFHLIEEIVNKNVVPTTSGQWICYREKSSNDWRYFRSYRQYLPREFYYYPYNLKELLSEISELKYSQLWELVKHTDCDLIYLINRYNPSIEFLTKQQLYKLALCPETFNKARNFQERFKGLTKDYIPFIREYNLDIDELTALSYLKVKNINYIRKYKYLAEENIRFLKDRVNLITLIDKTDFASRSFHEYRDYLDFAKKLGLNLKDKQILYPPRIKPAHDKLLKEYEQLKDKKINSAIKKRCKQLKCNVFSNKKYEIFPAPTYDALIDESSQQNNCVRTYAERIMHGECDIYFMRLVKDKNKSLITVEVRNNKVVQKRTKNNEITTKSQDVFLDNWEKNVLMKGNIV